MAKIVLKKGAGYKGEFYPPGAPIEMEDDEVLSMIEAGEDIQILGELKKKEVVKETTPPADEEEEEDEELEEEEEDDEEEEEEEVKPKQKKTTGNKRNK